MSVKSLILLAIALVGSAHGAQDPKILDQLVASTCGSFSSQMAGRPEIRQLIAERPIESSNVCACAVERAKQDARLSALLAMDNQAFAEAGRSESVKAYIIGRTLHAVLSCFNSELDSSLAASKALQ